MPTIINGQEALKMSEAAQYVRLTDPALRERIRKYNATHPDAPIQRHQSIGGRERYILKRDLDMLRELRPIS